MKPVARSILVLLASASLSAAAIAQPEPTAVPAAAEAPSPERLELAHKFLAVSAPEETLLEGFRAGVWKAAGEQLEEIEDASARTTAEARVGQVLPKLELALKPLLPRLTEAYAQVYAREFSAEELRQMTAFAETPAGKHYLAKTDLLNMDPAVFDAQMDLMQGVQPVLDDFRKQLCAEKAAMRVAAGDKKARCPLSDPEPQAG